MQCHKKDVLILGLQVLFLGLLLAHTLASEVNLFWSDSPGYAAHARTFQRVCTKDMGANPFILANLFVFVMIQFLAAASAAPKLGQQSAGNSFVPLLDVQCPSDAFTLETLTSLGFVMQSSVQYDCHQLPRDRLRLLTDFVGAFTV